MVSPFTFYRGAAKIMAADLKDTPRAGLDGAALRRRPPVELRRVRVAGTDADVRPERLRRDAPRAVRVRRRSDWPRASRSRPEQRLHARRTRRRSRWPRCGVPGGDGRVRRRWARWTSGTRTCPKSDLHGGDQGAGDRREGEQDEEGGARRPRSAPRRSPRRRSTRDSLQALSKLAEMVDGEYRIVSQPPIVVPLRELPPARRCRRRRSEHVIHEQFRAYRSPCRSDRRQLLERFEVIDVARKVVGVGSVGTRAFIVLLQGRDERDPLFLQVKEATASVLEDHLPKSRFRQPGERVVHGQRMMQAASDIFLGWTKGVEADRYLYWRQLRDMKGSAVVESMAPPASRSTPACAAGRWRGRMPGPGTRSRSPPTSGRDDGFDRSITGLRRTVRGSERAKTSRRSSERSARAGWTRSRTSDLAGGLRSTCGRRRPVAASRTR